MGEVTRYEIARFQEKVACNSDFSQVTELESFKSIMLDLIREEDKDRLCQRAYEVFKTSKRPILIPNLISWASIFHEGYPVTIEANKELFEALQKELVQVRDATEILKWRRTLGANFSEAHSSIVLLEQRLLELFNSISPKNTPDWFNRILINEHYVIDEMPKDCLDALTAAVRRIEASLPT